MRTAMPNKFVLMEKVDLCEWKLVFLVRLVPRATNKLTLIKMGREQSSVQTIISRDSCQGEYLSERTFDKIPVSKTTIWQFYA